MSATATRPETALVDRLVEIEERLSRLLVSGWRSAAAEAGELRHLAASIDGSGATELAARLTAVANAENAEDALRAIALATAACRLLRVHVAADVPAEGRWRTFADGAASGHLDRVIPLGTLTIPDGGDGQPLDVWSCLRMRGAFSADWILLKPVDLSPVWLRRALQGRLRWIGRFPLGAAEVQLCELAFAAPAPGFQPGQDPLEPFLATLRAETLEDDAWVLGGGGVLRAREYDPDAMAGYAWTNNSAPAWLREALRPAEWLLIWVQDEVETPVAAVQEDGAVVHLIPADDEI
jgi:hypothetical protein